MNQSNSTESGELTARQAAELLGIKLPTLYAYVSRGLLRSLPGTGSGRARRYLVKDVEALRDKNRGSAAAANALRFGEPVLDSGITEMTPSGPAYRGRLATTLARDGADFESVAELLWTGMLPESAPRWPVPEAAPRLAGLARLVPEDAPPASVRPLVLAAWASRDPGRFDPRESSVLPRARAVTRLLAASLALPNHPDRADTAWRAGTIADAVIVAFGAKPNEPRRRAMNAMLVLMADHELNASTFAARVAASAQADVYAALQAGLATLSGPLHGGASDQVEALLREIAHPDDAERVVHERARRGEPLPGFGHFLYRKTGDPRATSMLEAAWELVEQTRPGKRSNEVDRVTSLVTAMEAAQRPKPNVDAAAVAMRAAIGLPSGAVAGVFAVARSVGWVAHILEQYESGNLLRPRARYVGTPTEE
jgi:citrate synthase